MPRGMPGRLPRPCAWAGRSPLPRCRALAVPRHGAACSRRFRMLHVRERLAWCDRLAVPRDFQAAPMQQQVRLVSLPPLPPPAGAPPPTAAAVRVVGDQVVVDHLVLGDSTAAAFLVS